MITAAICLPQIGTRDHVPGAFEDGFKVLNWFAKQSNLAARGRLGAQSHIFYSCGASMVEPWLAAHGDTSGYPFGLTCLSCSSGI
uniref:Alpha/beta hydrolase fold-3 domain-containing protein n=1 Tax=Populus trichocarpa TaxID=3694 RepID=A0A3N7F731_POPTR